MNAYIAYMAEQIAQEIKSVDDPLILSIYLKAILHQRCEIGGAKEGGCKGCIFESHYCREMYEINVHELRKFDDMEEQQCTDIPNQQ